MSRRARSNTTVSLFPFLAVLLCAMGALLVILVITTRQIRDDAIEQAEADRDHNNEAVAKLDSNSEKPEEWPRWTIELGAATTLQVRSFPLPAPAPLRAPKPRFIIREAEPDPPDLTNNLAVLMRERLSLTSQRSLLDQAQQTALSQEDKLLLEIAKRESILKRADEAILQFSVRDREQKKELEALQRQARETAENLDQLQQENRQLADAPRVTPNVFKVVPYEGQHGTTRRPILIECTQGKIRFVPEGVELTERDLLGFSKSNNPLLAGVLTAENYWILQDRVVSNRNRPYVLLIVRPDGIAAYYGARQLLQEYGQRFGYELIDQDQELAYPEVDLEARSLIQAVIDRKLVERGAPSKVATSPFPHVNVRELESRLNREAPSRGGPTGLGSAIGSPAQNGHAASPKGVSSRNFKFVQTPRGLVKVPIESSPGGSFTEGKGGFPPRQMEQNGSLRNGSFPREMPTANAPKLLNPGLSEQGSRPISSDSEQTGPFDSLSDPGQTTSPSEDKISRQLDLFAEQGTSRSEHQDDATNPAQAPDAWTSLLKGQSSKSRASEKQNSTNSNSANSSRVTSKTTGQSGSSQQLGQPANLAQALRSPLAPLHHMAFVKPLRVTLSGQELRVDDRPPVAIAQNINTPKLMSMTVDELRQRVKQWPTPPDQFYWKPTVIFYIAPGGEQYFERLKPYFVQQGLLSDVKYLGTASAPERSRN